MPDENWLFSELYSEDEITVHATSQVPGIFFNNRWKVKLDP